MVAILSYIKNRYTFAEFIIELVELAVNSACVSGDRNVFMSIFFADDLGFGAALSAKLEQEILFVKF